MDRIQSCRTLPGLTLLVLLFLVSGVYSVIHVRRMIGIGSIFRMVSIIGGIPA